MALEQFDPPGFVEDLDPSQRKAWSEWIATQLDEARARNGDSGLSNNGPRYQFFNLLRDRPDADATEKDITWKAFPRVVEISSVSDMQRWRRADASRLVQDEYCEWSVRRDPETHKITRVTFTSEGPEYWQFLAAVNPELVLKLYQQHVDKAVKKEDLFKGGVYQRRNKWNSSSEMGAMHLIQDNNTLGAEIELAAAATLVRRRDGTLLTSERELIDCGRYGQPERHSDPHIGGEVNALARAKADVSLANPVGLCIAGLSTVGWKAPDGTNPADFWTITRGTKAKALRAVYEVPVGKKFVVGDVTINGRAIQFGAQIADFITIKLTGLATRLGKSKIPAVDGCVGVAATKKAMLTPDLAKGMTVASILTASRQPPHR